MSRVFVLVAALLLTACTGWDRPIYQNEPANGDFLIGNWVSSDNEVFKIISDQGRYFVLALEKHGASSFQFHVTHHNDTIFMSWDVTSVRGFSVKDDQPTKEKQDRPPEFFVLSIEKTDDGIFFRAADYAALSKLLEAKGVVSTENLCRSLRRNIPDDEKPTLVERCALINTEFVERTLGDVPLPVAMDKQQLVKPVHY